MPKLEVCCYSAECAIAAEQAGADRIELLCSQRRGVDAQLWNIAGGA